MADFVPEKAVQFSVRRQVVPENGIDGRAPDIAGILENDRVPKNIGADQNRAAVSPGKIGLVWKLRCDIASSRLAKLGNDVINADGKMRLNRLMVFAGKTVLQFL